MCLPSCVPCVLPQSVRLLPDPPVLSGGAELRLWVGAGGAPGGELAALHDGTHAGAHGADVRGRPVALQQAVQPATQRRPRQAGVGLRLLHCPQTHRQPQHGVQAVEALLHVGVLGRAAVQPQGVLWTPGGEGGGEGGGERREEW